jgi:hypothetical protein
LREGAARRSADRRSPSKSTDETAPIDSVGHPFSPFWLVIA